MKCIVIYLSATGNTRKIAEVISDGVKQAAGHCDLLKLKDASPHHLGEYDLIGIGCPVMGFGEGPFIRNFIENMRFVGGKHSFAFATHGTMGEYFASSIVPKLNSQGLIVLGTWDCYAPVYISGMPDPYPTSGHPDEIDLKEAAGFAKNMVEISKRVYAGETGLIPPAPKPPEITVDEMLKEAIAMEQSGEVIPIKEMNKVWRQVNMEKCAYPECKLCMENCPVNGIDLTVVPPVIAKPCMNCMLCAKICPTGAISENEWSLEAYADHARKQMALFYLPPLERAEAEGRFRRLVPVEKIGLDTPIYKKYNKHPQWIIGKGLQPKK